MHISRASFLLFLAAIPVSYAFPQVTEPKYLDPEHYRVDEFIRLAVTLQSLGRETAIKRLHTMGQDIRSQGSVIILCRMLFTQRPRVRLQTPEGWTTGFVWSHDGCRLATVPHPANRWDSLSDRRGLPTGRTSGIRRIVPALCGSELRLVQRSLQTRNTPAEAGRTGKAHHFG